MGAKYMSRLGIVVAALVLALAFAPALGVHKAYAGGGTEIGNIIAGFNSDDTAEVGMTLTVKMSDLDTCYGGAFTGAYGSGVATAGWSLSTVEFGDSNPQFKEGTYSAGVFSYTVGIEDAGKWIRFETASKEDTGYNNQTEAHQIKALSTSYLIKTNTKKDNSFVLVGHSASSPFSSINIYDGEGKCVDSFATGISGNNDFSKSFSASDLAKYDPGFYNIVGVLSDKTKLDMSLYDAEGNAFYKTFFTSPITEKPSIKRDSNHFSTGYDYVCFRPNFTVPKDSHTGKAIFGYIWLQLYDTKTKTWGDYYGPFDSYENLYTEYFTGNASKGTKIAANRTYQARIQYRKDAAYNGTTFTLYGPYSNTVTIKTGKGTKPAIKSIKAKATKVKKTALIQKAHWDIYGKWHPYKKSYLMTTTYKVTVKLKKKPGTAGLMIGDKKVKGNKKTYTATFTDSGKLKGKKITFGICTYNDKVIGAYGKSVKKKVKIK